MLCSWTTFYRRAAIFFALGALLVGCGEVAAESSSNDQGASSSGLIDAESADETDFPATGGVVLATDDIEPSVPLPWLVDTDGEMTEYGIWCTGTLVSPTEVVTAAHCLRPDLIGDHAAIPVPHFTTAADTRPISGDEVYEGQSVHIHPDFPGVDLRHDIAVLRLAEPVEGVEYARLPDENLADELSGTRHDLVGYGFRDWSDLVLRLVQAPDENRESFAEYVEDYQPGVKQQGQTRVTEIYDYVLLMGLDDDSPYPADIDSGGPAFARLDDRPDQFLTGVVSGPQQDEERLQELRQLCHSRPDGDECTTGEAAQWCQWIPEFSACVVDQAIIMDPTDAVVGTVYTRVDTHRDWLQQVLDEEGDDDWERACSATTSSPTPSAPLLVFALAALALMIRRKQR